MSNAPIATIRVGRIKATIWENTDEQDRTYHATTLTRSYRDKNNQWQETTSFSLEDMPRLRLASDKAFELIHERLSDLGKGKGPDSAKMDEAEREPKAAKKSTTRKRAKQTTFTEKIDAERQNGAEAKR